MRKVLSLLFCFTFTIASAQFTNVWVFGNQGRLDFNSGSPVTGATPGFNNFEACGTVCDAGGNLMFYTDGQTVWNRTGTVMPNGTLLGGLPSATSTLILPKPGDCNKFYLFCTQDHTVSNPKIFYSEIDMCLDNGFGDVVTGVHAIQMGTNVSEKLCVVPNSNGTDFWLISHRLGNNEYLVYQITPVSINIVPTSYFVGSSIAANDNSGYLKYNPVLNKLAMAVLWGNFLDVVTFNPATGAVTTPFTNFGPICYAGANGTWYGVEFSPNGQYLYATQSGFGGVNAVLWQIDLMASTVTQIFTTTPLPVSYYYCALQLAPDGKIYMARNTDASLSVINNPDLAGLACNFVFNGISLPATTNSRAGLPLNVMPINLNVAPLVFSLGNDTTLCPFSPFTLTAPAGCLYNYVWQDSSTAQTFNVTQPGTYSVQISNACAIGHDTLVASTGTGNLSVTASPMNICPGDSSMLIATGAVNYTWTPATGLSSTTNDTVYAFPSVPTTYVVNGSGGLCSMLPDSVSIGIISPPVFSLPPDDTLCPFTSTPLNVPPLAAYSFLWNTGSVTFNTNATQPGIYWVQLTGQCGVYTDSVNFSGDTTQIYLSVGGGICPGDSLLITAYGGSNYTWTPSASLSSSTGSSVFAFPLSSTVYTISGTNAFCSISDTVHINMYPLPVFSVNPNPATFCAGGSVVLNATAGNAYVWSPAAGLSSTTGSSVTASSAQTTTYYLTATNAFGCAASDSTLVVVTPNDTISASPDTTACSGTVLQLSGNGASNLFWSPNTNLSCFNCSNPFATVNGTVTYIVQSTDACVIPDTITVTAVTPAVNAWNDTMILSHGMAQLFSSFIGDTFYWCADPSLSCATCANPTAQPLVTTVYCVTSELGGCKVTDTVTVWVNNDCFGLYLPNAFSPNADGINDVFRPLLIQLDDFNFLRIYNRWGQMLFETLDPAKGWDGFYESIGQPLGVYVYVVDYICDGKPQKMKGNVTLVR